MTQQTDKERRTAQNDPKKREEAAKRLDQALEKIRQDRQRSLVPKESDNFGYIENPIKTNEVAQPLPKEGYQLTLDDLTTSSEQEDSLDSIEITQQLETDTEHLQEQILWQAGNTRKRKRAEKKALKRKKKEVKKQQKIQKETQVEKKQQQVVSKQKQIRKIPWKWILVPLLILGVLFGGYWYKTTIYDPNNVITDQQQKTYDKLVEYADEWDMLSEMEKKELEDYQDKYNDLVPKQKEDINAYFKEHTGKSLTQIFKDLKNAEKDKVSQEASDVEEIKNYLKNWKTYDRTTKLKIVDYKETYLNMTAEHQDEINAAAKEASGYEFMSLVKYYEPSDTSDDQSSSQQSSSNDDLSSEQAQAEIATLNQTILEYQNYGAALQQQLANTTDPQMAAQIQLEIAANNQIIQEYQIQLNQYQTSDSTSQD